MITIAIVEDEEAYAKQLTEYIEQYQQGIRQTLSGNTVYGWR